MVGGGVCYAYLLNPKWSPLGKTPNYVTGIFGLLLYVLEFSETCFFGKVA